MHMPRRLFGVPFLLLGAFGFLLSLYGIGVAWFLRDDLSDKAVRAFERIEPPVNRVAELLARAAN
jgi:hypothetical protein